MPSGALRRLTQLKTLVLHSNLIQVCVRDSGIQASVRDSGIQVSVRDSGIQVSVCRLARQGFGRLIADSEDISQEICGKRSCDMKTYDDLLL